MVNGLQIPQRDLLLVDEGQDLPRCKAEFCRRMARRFVLVGDTHQAIYGFAGADTESIPRIQRFLAETTQGCTVLRLTETRRCGKAIVRDARHYVPDFKAHESNPEGKVVTARIGEYAKDLRDGDMVLSRVNAPLVSQALKLIRQGHKAVVRGRDFGGQLISFVERMKADSVPDLIGKVDDWRSKEVSKENAKRNPSDARIQSLDDRYDVIMTFSENAATVQEVLDRINLVFAGKQCPRCRKHFNEDLLTCPCLSCKTETGPDGYPIGQKLITPDGVQFSSIHKAKGLEANRVFIIRTKDAPLPHPMARTAWAQGQEQNLVYVAITRAIHELTYVTD